VFSISIDHCSGTCLKRNLAKVSDREDRPLIVSAVEVDNDMVTDLVVDIRLNRSSPDLLIEGNCVLRLEGMPLSSRHLWLART
jgi:hypothetical protein